MEDVLDVYQRPYDPLNPVVCIDETNKQLIKEIRIPCAPGQPEIVDYEYERNGVANVFMIFEPLGGNHDTIVTKTQTAIDFAHILKHTSDVMYPHLLTGSTHMKLRHCTKHSRQKKHTELPTDLSGIILQSTQVGWIWQKLKLELCPVRLLRNHCQTY